MRWPSRRIVVQLAGALVLVLIAATAILLRAYGLRPITASPLRLSPTPIVTPSATSTESTASPTAAATPTTSALDASPSPSPSLPTGWVPHANDAVIAYDEAHGYPLLLTLELAQAPPGTAETGSSWLSATWKWDGSHWVLLHPPVSPPNMNANDGNTYSNLVYDAALHEVVVLAKSGAAYGSGGGRTMTTWGWTGVTWEDLQMTPMPSGDAADNYLTFDKAHSQLVLLQSTAYAGTTQTWTGDGRTWTRRDPATQPNGPPRAGGIAYDPRSSTVLVFGGTDGMGASNVNETWSWDGSTWKRLQPVARPAGGNATLAYDAANQQMLLFEAAYATAGAGTRVTSTWTWDGASWTSVAASGGPAFGGDMTYNPARRELIIAGNTGEMYGAMQTWIYSAGQWRRA